MKALIAIMALSTCTAGAYAASGETAYGGFARGNADVNSELPMAMSLSISATQPGIGTRVDRYHGFEKNNPDLFSSQSYTGRMSRFPNIYGAYDNHDL